MGVRIPRWEGLGYGMFFIAAALAVTGTLGFYLLNRQITATRSVGDA